MKLDYVVCSLSSLVVIEAASAVFDLFFRHNTLGAGLDGISALVVTVALFFYLRMRAINASALTVLLFFYLRARARNFHKR